MKPNGEINEIETLYLKDIGRLVTMLASLKSKNSLLDLDIDKAVEMLERQYNTAIIPELRDSLKSAISRLKDFAGVNGGAAKLSVGGIFTGSAADYANRSRQGGRDDGPSLLKIGSGEGTQVYGWGLYGSAVRGGGERMPVRRRRLEPQRFRLKAIARQLEVYTVGSDPFVPTELI